MNCQGYEFHLTARRPEKLSWVQGNWQETDACVHLPRVSSFVQRPVANVKVRTDQEDPRPGLWVWLEEESWLLGSNGRASVGQRRNAGIREESYNSVFATVVCKEGLPAFTKLPPQWMASSILLLLLSCGQSPLFGLYWLEYVIQKQRDGSVGKALAMQAWGPGFDPRHPHTKLDVVVHAGNPSSGGAGASRFLGFASQPTWTNHWAPGLRERHCLRKLGRWLLRNRIQDGSLTSNMYTAPQIHLKIYNNL